MMRTYFDVTESDTDQKAREQIAGKLLLLDEGFAEDLPLLFDFLAVPDPERPAPRMDPEARQRPLLGMIKRLVHAGSPRNPGITCSRTCTGSTPQARSSSPHRRGAAGLAHADDPQLPARVQRPMDAKSYYRQIALAPLGPEAIEALLADLLGERSLARRAPGPDPRADRRQPVLHRGGRAVAGRGRQHRGRARRLPAGAPGR